MLAVPRQHELIRRRIRETEEVLAAVERGEWWCPMPEREYRRHLLHTLDELEFDLDEVEREHRGEV